MQGDIAATAPPAPNRAGRTVYLTGAILFWGFLLSGAMFWVLREAERKEALASFQGWATITAGAVNHGLAFHQEILEAMEGLFMSTENVTRQNFRSFCTEIIGRHPGMQALAFSPRVLDSGREFHEELAHQQGATGFRFTERAANGTLVPAARRPEYFPVFYVAPLQGNQPALGFDLASDPQRRAALEKARDSGQMAASARLTLLLSGTQQKGMILFYPLYRPGSDPHTVQDRREQLMGFALGVFRLNDIVDTALATLFRGDTEVRILDLTEPDQEELVYSRDGQGNHDLGPALSKDLPKGLAEVLSEDAELTLPGRRWVLRYTATPEFLARHTSLQPAIILLFGLAQTLLLAFITKRRSRQLDLAAAFARERAEAAARLNRQILQLEREKEAYREQEARWRLILRGIRAGIVSIDPETFRILDMNSVAGELLGLEPVEALGKDCRELYWKEIEGEPSCLTPETDGDCLSGRESLYQRPDGRLIPVTRTILSAPVYGRLQLFEILFDISDKKTLERRLGLAQKLESVGLLAAGIAHEINTPIQYVGDNIRFLQESFAGLSGVLQSCRTLAADPRDPSALAQAEAEVLAAMDQEDMDFLMEEIPKSISQSLEGVERVATIVQAMKRFSRLGNEDMSLVDVNKAIENTLVVTRNEWKYVADVTTDLDPAQPQVRCLPGDFNQVLVNILVNAAQAIGEMVKNTQSKGTIAISTGISEGMAEIRVSDTGPGIPAENLDKIFDPFFTTKEVGKGTGQGLAITHDIVVEKHKGTISVLSEAGQGATFVVRLPLDQAPEAPSIGSFQ